ncbi:MAG: DUF4185 domain-containing protein [Chloroflexota bacterium]
MTISGSPLPYPPSPALALVSVSESITRREDLDGDDWPITWAADDQLYAAYGDGWGCRPIEKHTKRNTGLVRLSGPAGDFRGEEVPCPWFGGGAENPNFKGCGLLAVDGVLYHFLRYQVADPACPPRRQIAAKLIWSPDYGQTWQNGADYGPDVQAMRLFFHEPDHAFHSPTFLQAGQEYALAQDEYVYLYSPREDRRRANDHLDLARVPRGSVAERRAHEFFAGLDTGDRPSWTRDITRRQPVFAFPGYVGPGDVVYNAPRGRYLLATCGGQEGGQSSLALFDAPHPWGPWTSIGIVPRWGSGQHGDSRYDPRLPANWIGDDGLSATLVYSDRIISDKLNLQAVHFAPPPAS